MGKADQNKKAKLERLLNTSFELFTSKGLNKTSISDIVERAGGRCKRNFLLVLQG